MDGRAKRRAPLARPDHLCEDRHIKDSRVIAAVAAAVVVMPLAVGASSAQTPPIPPIPTPPTVHIPGEKIMKFKLVFEGSSNADKIDDIGGQTGSCDAQLHADIQEDVTFGRGKGVTMEFVRFKEGKHFRYGFQRSAGNPSSSFNVVAKVHRTASGAGDLTQHPNESSCPAQHFDAGQSSDCGKTITDNAKWGLKVVNDHFSPRPATPLGGNFLGPDECGAPPPGTAFSSDVAELFYQWPTPSELPFEPIPLHKMFNKHFHAFKVEFKSLKREQKGKSGVPPVLVETTDDHGSAEATVRFIRVH
jgi:hypothetical protein